MPESILKHLSLQILKALDYLHDQGITHSSITSSQISFDRRGKVRLAPGWGHILKHKDETCSTLDQQGTICKLLAEHTARFKNKQKLLKDKFAALTGSSLKQPDSSSYSHSIQELKRNDLFDLGVVLIICATGGLDMVNEELLSKMCNFSQHCCFIHALSDIDTTSPDFDAAHISTLVSLRRILNRISPQAQDFICLCMQQRFTDVELQKIA